MDIRTNYEHVDSFSELFNKMRPDYEVISGLISVIKPETIAELGCGSGRLLPVYLESDAKNIFGFDLEEKMYTVFENSSKDERVKGGFHDIKTGLPDLPGNALIIATGSLLKHLHPSERALTWQNISNSLSSDQVLFVEHCSYIYGIDHDTEWRTYFSTLRAWWDECDWDMIKNFEWRKKSSPDIDILCYRKKGDVETQITTYPYPISEYSSDISNADLNFTVISNNYNKKRRIEHIEKHLGLITKGVPANFDAVVDQIKSRVLS